MGSPTQRVDFLYFFRLIFLDAFNERPARFLGPVKRGKPDRETTLNADRQQYQLECSKTIFPSKNKEAFAISRILELNAQIKLCNLLILLKTFNLKLNTACENIFFAGESTRVRRGQASPFGGA